MYSANTTRWFLSRSLEKPVRRAAYSAGATPGRPPGPPARVLCPRARAVAERRHRHPRLGRGAGANPAGAGRRARSRGRADRRRQRLRRRQPRAGRASSRRRREIARARGQPRLRRRLQRRRRAGVRRPAGVLNPDARPLPGFGEAIRRPWLEERGWEAWMALVACEGGARVNTLGNPVHFTGIAWAGRPRRADAGGARAAGEVAGRLRRLPGDPAAAPGARLGGFPARVLPLPRGHRPLAAAAARRRQRSGSSRAAVVDHDYEFDAGRGEVALAGAQPLGLPDPRLPGAAAGAAGAGAAAHRAGADPGRARRRLGARRSCSPSSTCCAGCPRLLRERRAIQAQRAVTAGEFAALAHAGPRLALHPAARPRRARRGSPCAPTGALVRALLGRR